MGKRASKRLKVLEEQPSGRMLLREDVSAILWSDRGIEGVTLDVGMGEVLLTIELPPDLLLGLVADEIRRRQGDQSDEGLVFGPLAKKPGSGP